MKCEVCGKGYKSRSGLRRHVKSQHPGDATPGEVSTKEKTSQAGPSVPGPGRAVAGALYEKALVDACKALGIKSEDVMAYKVYDDKVVIIEGPTGWKRVWQRE